MANLYATLSQLRARLLGMESNDDDDILLEVLEDASRQLERATHRLFYPRILTRYYDYQSTFELKLNPEDDLLSVSSLTSFQDSVTIASSDYHLMCGESYNLQPYDRIKLDRARGAVFGYSGTAQKANKITGVYGYHNDYSNAHGLSGATVGETYNSSDTTLTVSNGTKFQKGQTIRIDSEWLYISDIATNDLSVERAVNGGAAAAHSSGTVIYIYKPMRDVERVTLRYAVWLYKQLESPFSFELQTGADGRVIIPPQAPPEVHRFVKQYQRML